MNDPARRNDRELFEAAVAGDSDAFAELAGRHARGLHDFALRGTQDEEQAADAVESVFRRVREPGTFAPSQIEFRTWLYSLTLVEVLAVSSETRLARISTDDERFYQQTSDVDHAIARSAWQAARGLRTRDYCVLDLTLRRGLTPEEVAEAASLTRSNLYASIGRARGAFEETFAAMLLFDYGRGSCAALNEMVEGAPGPGLRPALRHQIIEHADDCASCRSTLVTLPPAAGVFVSLTDVALPEDLVRRILTMPPAQPQAPYTLPPVVTPAPPVVPPPFGVTNAEEVSSAGAAVPDQPGDEAAGMDARGEEGQEAEAISPEEPGPAAGESREAAGEVAVAAGVATDVPATDDEGAQEARRPSFIQRAAGGLATVVRQPMLGTYLLMGVVVVLALYLGFAVAQSLQGGGSDSGAVPLDTAPGVTEGRALDCGDTTFELNAGDATTVTFDETALEGYGIAAVSFAPVSDFATFEDVEVTMEGPFAIRFIAAEQETAEVRTEEFELRIRWERDGEVANSACPLIVNVQP